MLKNRLEEIRMKQFGKSSEEFAEYLELNYKTYSAYENGRYNPPLPKAIMIAAKIGLPIEYIWYF